MPNILSLMEPVQVEPCHLCWVSPEIILLMSLCSRPWERQTRETMYLPRFAIKKKGMKKLGYAKIIVFS